MPDFEVFKGNTREFLKKFKTTNIFIDFLIIVLVVALICVFAIFKFYSNIENSNKIQYGVFIKGIDVSGLTRQQAIEKVSKNLEDTLNDHLELSYKNNVYYLEIEQIEARFDVEASVDLAIKIAKTGTFKSNISEYINVALGNINIDPILTYNEDELIRYISNIEMYLPDQLQQADYYVEDGNLIVINGVNGAGIEYDQLKELVLKSIQDISFKNKIIDIPTYVQYPDPIDIASIHEDLYTEMQNAYFTTEPYAVFPDVTGVDFDTNELREMIEENGKAEKYEIALDYTYPRVTIDDLGREAFPDLLASFSTKYVQSNTNRTTNLRLAANKIDGKVVMPGDIFSYNRVVGKRTTSAGYKNAAIYQDGDVVDGLGGGICQISTTLYNACIAADMEIEMRRNHMFVPSYADAGKDATVVWGSQDFQFKNRRNYPIKIETSVSDGIANVRIYGLHTDDDYDKIYITTETIKNSGNSLVVDSYRVFEKDGRVVKKTKLYRDTYKKH